MREVLGTVFLGCLGVIGVITLSLGISAFFAWILMLLWNFIAPTFGLPVLSFWISWAAMILVSWIGRLLSPKRSVKIES